MTGRIITIFRNRLCDDAVDVYHEYAPAMTRLARDMPGFVDAKTFVADDGERVTVVTFADRESHDAWRTHPVHEEAKRRGIEEFYAEYSIQVGETTYEHRFSR